MTVEELYKNLKSTQEKKGFYFNPDHNWVLEVLKGILTNKERYGYGACPCRLATGNRERDHNIICPCLYRDEDVKKYDSCYCRLYVSADVATGKKKAAESVPERWLRK